MEENNQILNSYNDLSNSSNVSDNSSTISETYEKQNSKMNLLEQHEDNITNKSIKHNKLKLRIEELERINNQLTIENFELYKKLDSKNIPVKIFEDKINDLEHSISKLQMEYFISEKKSIESNLERFNKESEYLALDKKVMGLNYHVQYLINILQERDKEIYYLKTEFNKQNGIINEQSRLINNNLYQIPLARHPPPESISQFRERSNSEFIPIEKKTLKFY